MSRLRALLSTLVAAAACGCASGTADYGPRSAPAPAQTGRVVSVTLAALPESYRGTCPASITFLGEITTDGPVTVEYVFTRSDKATDTITKRLSFARAGTKQTAAHTWLLGPSLQRYAGWQVLTVTSPNAIESARAHFTVDCQDVPR